MLPFTVRVLDPVFLFCKVPDDEMVMLMQDVLISRFTIPFITTSSPGAGGMLPTQVAGLVQSPPLAVDCTWALIEIEIRSKKKIKIDFTKVVIDVFMSVNFMFSKV